MTDQFKEQTPEQERRQFWESHLEEWSLSGLSQVKYSRQNNLRSNHFTYWKRKFQRQALCQTHLGVPDRLGDNGGACKLRFF